MCLPSPWSWQPWRSLLSLNKWEAKARLLYEAVTKLRPVPVPSRVPISPLIPQDSLRTKASQTAEGSSWLVLGITGLVEGQACLTISVTLGKGTQMFGVQYWGLRSTLPFRVQQVEIDVLAETCTPGCSLPQPGPFRLSFLDSQKPSQVISSHGYEHCFSPRPSTMVRSALGPPHSVSQSSSIPAPLTCGSRPFIASCWT